MFAQQDYEDIFVELGAIFISKVCRISVSDFLDFQHLEKELPEDAVARLDFLKEIVKHLEGAYKRFDGSIQKWFNRRRKGLGNQSPYQVFMWPGIWKPEGEMPQKILDLAKGTNVDAT